MSEVFNASLPLNDPRNYRWLYRLLGVALVVLWLSSLYFPVFYACHPALPTRFVPSNYRCTQSSGLFMLTIGWLGPFIGQFGWYANLCLVAIVVFLVIGKRPGLVLTAPAILLASEVLIDRSLYNEVKYDEIVSYQAGFWIWFICSIIAFAVSLIGPPDGFLLRWFKVGE